MYKFQRVPLGSVLAVGLTMDEALLEANANGFGFVVLDDPVSAFAPSILELVLIRLTYGLLVG